MSIVQDYTQLSPEQQSALQKVVANTYGSNGRALSMVKSKLESDPAYADQMLQRHGYRIGVEARTGISDNQEGMSYDQDITRALNDGAAPSKPAASAKAPATGGNRTSSAAKAMGTDGGRPTAAAGRGAAPDAMPKRKPPVGDEPEAVHNKTEEQVEYGKPGQPVSGTDAFVAGAAGAGIAGAAGAAGYATNRYLNAADAQARANAQGAPDPNAGSAAPSAPATGTAVTTRGTTQPAVETPGGGPVGMYPRGGGTISQGGPAPVPQLMYGPDGSPMGAADQLVNDAIAASDGSGGVSRSIGGPPAQQALPPPPKQITGPAAQAPTGTDQFVQGVTQGRGNDPLTEAMLQQEMSKPTPRQLQSPEAWIATRAQMLSTQSPMSNAQALNQAMQEFQELRAGGQLPDPRTMPYTPPNSGYQPPEPGHIPETGYTGIRNPRVIPSTAPMPVTRPLPIPRVRG